MVQVKNKEEDGGYCEQSGCKKDKADSIDHKSCQRPIVLYLWLVSQANTLRLFTLRLLLQEFPDVYQYRIWEGACPCGMWFDVVAEAFVQNILRVSSRYIAAWLRRFVDES